MFNAVMERKKNVNLSVAPSVAEAFHEAFPRKGIKGTAATAAMAFFVMMPDEDRQRWLKIVNDDEISSSPEPLMQRIRREMAPAADADEVDDKLRQGLPQLQAVKPRPQSAKRVAS